jgi:hypothetical protein
MLYELPLISKIGLTILMAIPLFLIGAAAFTSLRRKE